MILRLVVMESSSLPISLFRQYIFCPRVVFFQEVMGIHVPMPHWTKQGNDHHKKQVLLSQQRTLTRFDLEKGKMVFDVNLSSPIYKIHGICDAVIETDEEIVVIDFKLTKKVQRGHIYQLAGYALCAEEKFKKRCQLGFILTGEKAKANIVEINAVLRSEVIQILAKMDELLILGTLPESSANEHQCGQCEYFNYCNDRF